MRKLKRFLTHYTKKTNSGTESWCGVAILAFNWDDVLAKVKIHNKYTKNKLIAYGIFDSEIK